MERIRILIIGVGRIGRALAGTMAPTERAEIALFDTDTSRISHSIPLSTLSRTASVVFLCVPSSVARQCLGELRTTLPAGATVISLLKGLDPVSAKTMAELCIELLPAPVRSAMLGGPMLSGEIMAGRAAFGVLGTDADTFAAVRPLFAPTLVRVVHSADALGVAGAGVLKNVYALGLGMAHALAVGDNAVGWLMTQALHEMADLLPQLGGQPATAYSLVGLGDLLATGVSTHSRNRTVGTALVQGTAIPIPSEGLVTLPILQRRLTTSAALHPFFTAVARVVVEKKGAAQEFSALLDHR